MFDLKRVQPPVAAGIFRARARCRTGLEHRVLAMSGAPSRSEQAILARSVRSIAAKWL
jgi:hypothetical protein